MRRMVLAFLIAVCFALPASAVVSITAAKTQSLAPDGVVVSYAVSFTNTGDTTMPDSPGWDEFIDPVSGTLTNVSANTTGNVGTINIDHVSNKVYWNGSVAAGQTVVVNITGQVRSGAPAGTPISNQATVYFDTDGNGTNDGAVATNTVSFTVPSRVVHASITKAQITPNPIVAGSGAGNLVYRITATTSVANARSASLTIKETLPSATDVTLVSVVPSSGTWYPGLQIWETDMLLPGQSATLDVTMTVGSGAPIGTNVFSNTAELTGGSFDFFADPPALVSVATSVEAAPAPAIRAELNASPLDGAYLPGRRVAFDIGVFNDGTGPLPDGPGDEIVDILPAELDVLSASIHSSGVAVVDPVENSVRWSGSIPAGDSVHLHIEARIAADAAGTIGNEITVAGASAPFSMNIVVGQADGVVAIPATSTWALLILGAFLAAAALRVLR